jgi:predicted amidohydrolase
MRAGFLQFNPVFGDIRGNVEKVARMLETQSADLIVLPELFNTGYQFISMQEVRELSEEVPSGYTTHKLLQLSKEKSCYIVAGLAERDGNSFYNSALLIGPEGFVGIYRKTHLFSEEKSWFSPGDTGFRVWETPFGNIGIMICFDWFFPESARTLALKGADIIAHPSNLVLPHCPDAMVTRCLENRVFSVTANRTGAEERGGKEPLVFIGTSEIVSPSGKILRRAARDKEELGFAEIDPAEARDKNLNPFNNLFDDRREEHYRP